MASKVLHLRNLPWLCREEELVELCRPFGEIVYIKCNFGANRNQAFVEFAELNQAMSMVSYYASSSEPANVRGQTVYIQYSNRQEIGNYNKSAGGIAGNVLIVTLEGVQRSDVSIEVIHAIVVVTYSAWIRRPMFPRRKFSLSAFCIGRYTTCTLFSFF